MAKDNKDKKTKKVGRISGTVSELKQVSWPSFKTTMKRLGAVLVVTLFFLVILTGIDALLGFIHRELFQIAAGAAGDYLNPSQIAALIVGGVLVIGAIAGVIIYKVRKARSKKD